MMYKFYVFAPRDKKLIRRIIDAASENGAGKIGNYSACAFIIEGIGTWKPEEGADPHIGTVGKVEEAEEVKIEMECPEDKIERIIEAVRAIHPYEEVVIDVVEIKRFK